MDKLQELLSANEAQAKEITQLKASLATAQGEATQAKSDLETVKASLATVTTERDTLKASQSDFDKRVAAEVAKAGIRPTPVAKVTPGAKSAPVATMSMAEFNKLSDFERNTFIRDGGKLSD